jgi:predicted O-linked N-acetylglucosamine transferase (SPINDLY family)
VAIADLKQAIAHHRAGRMKEAAACYEAALFGEEALAPELRSRGFAGLAALRLAQGRPEDARRAGEAALEAGPGSAEAFNVLGVALMELGQPGKAAERLADALDRVSGPGRAAIHNNLGAALLDLGSIQKAADHISRALELDPAMAEAENNLGRVLLRIGRYREAAEKFRKAAAINPDFAIAHANLGSVLLQDGRLIEAEVALERALELNPRMVEAINNMGNLRVRTRRLDEGLALYRRALEIRPGHAAAGSNLIFALDFHPAATNEELFAERKRWNETNAAPFRHERREHTNDPEPERRLRIGYVSADFRRHSAAFIFGPAVLNHDRDEVETFFYCNSPVRDYLTDIFRAAADNWRPINAMADGAVADLIRDDAIDVLVDLSGHSSGNRLLVFARRPAPVQVTAWGNAVGTGLETMDYLFSDPVYMAAEDRAFVAEEIYDLPCAISYLCPANAPEVSPLPAPANGFITFGCFSKTIKITAPALDLWARVLKMVGDSRMLFKDTALDIESERDRLRIELAARGIDPGRLDFLGSTPWTEHMNAYGKVDIVLDPARQAAGTTTLESLWMGAPVVVLKGGTIASRGSASALAGSGLGHWIAETAEDYVTLAVEKAADIEALAELRARLRELIRKNPIGDHDLYARAVEAAYRQMWRKWCRGT